MMNLDNKLEQQLESLINSDKKIDIEEVSDLQNFQPYLVDYGYDLLEEGKLDEAYKVFNLGAYLDNQNADILNGLGITLCELGRINDAKKILKRAVRIKSNDPITIANLAGICWETGDIDSAIYYYNKSLEIKPILEDIFANLINLYLDSGHLYMAFITCLNFQKAFPGNEEAKELLEDVIINLAISFY